MCLRREEGCEAFFVRPREEVDPLKKEKSSMAVITRLAVHLVSKNLPLTSKGLQWFLDW
jgi:hypothetical protein